jgi:hypothetical protein
VLNLLFGTDSLQDPRFDPLSHAVEVAWRKGLVVVARAVRAAPAPLRHRPGDLLLDSLAVPFTDGYPAAVPAAEAALHGRSPGSGRSGS